MNVDWMFQATRWTFPRYYDTVYIYPIYYDIGKTCETGLDYSHFTDEVTEAKGSSVNSPMGTHHS